MLFSSIFLNKLPNKSCVTLFRKTIQVVVKLYIQLILYIFLLIIFSYAILKHIVHFKICFVHFT